MERIRQSLVKTFSLCDNLPAGSFPSSPFSFAFDRDVFASSPVSLSPQQIVERLVKDLSSFRKELPFDLLVLPEMWNTPYHNACFASYAEYVPDCSPRQQSASASQEEEEKKNRESSKKKKSELETEGEKEDEEEGGVSSSPSFAFMSELARSLEVFVVGGSIVERRESKKRSLSVDEGAEKQLGRRTRSRRRRRRRCVCITLAAYMVGMAG